MLVDENGSFVGQITGGCAEVALAEHAVESIRARCNDTQRYGLNSRFFDIQLPCGSGIDVHFDCCTGAEMLARLESRKMVEQIINTKSRQYLMRHLPVSRLLLFGQGPILSALARLAISCQFQVVCLVYDQATKDQLMSENIQSEWIDQRVERQDLNTAIDQYCDAYTAAVSLFHEHDMELQILLHLLQSEAFFLGALGSQATQKKRIRDLIALGAQSATTSRLHGPVGINITASTPIEIAVSILAQLIDEQPRPTLVALKSG
jgi:xanthine dehydrogenase accessory factor